MSRFRAQSQPACASNSIRVPLLTVSNELLSCEFSVFRRPYFMTACYHLRRVSSELRPAVDGCRGGRAVERGRLGGRSPRLRLSGPGVRNSSSPRERTGGTTGQLRRPNPLRATDEAVRRPARSAPVRGPSDSRLHSYPFYMSLNLRKISVSFS